ncbi:hypothetical protein D8S78_21120 [Natrialba swarupiae]|nr:hypothetical protein [Natrialba swarupiae]
MASASRSRRVLPAKVFNDEEIFEAELRRIFGQCWVFIGHESEVSEPGDYARRYIGKDPFIFVRDEDGEIRVLFDSCTHHGAKVCKAEQGNTSHFRCPYHGWTFKTPAISPGSPSRSGLPRARYRRVGTPRSVPRRKLQRPRLRVHRRRGPSSRSISAISSGISTSTSTSRKVDSRSSASPTAGERTATGSREPTTSRPTATTPASPTDR